MIGKYRIVLYSNVATLPQDLQDKVEIRLGDFGREKKFGEFVRDADIIYHLISTTTPSDDTGSIEREIAENVNPTIRLLEALKEKPNCMMVFFSSGGTIYGNADIFPTPENAPLLPLCSYGVQKASIEHYIRQYHHLYGLRYRILRISNPYGLSQDPAKKQGAIPIFIRKVMSGEEISIWGDGENVRDYIFIEDLVDAVNAAVKHQADAATFNIGSGQGYSIRQVINIICKKCGREAILRWEEERRCDVKKSILDISLLHSVAGWQPKHTLEKGINDIIKAISYK
jgi:UDP-glucose 4-epimerase